MLQTKISEFRHFKFERKLVGGQQIYCSHQGTCPGCPLMYEKSTFPDTTRLRLFAEEAGAEISPLGSGSLTQYRIRSRLAVRGKQGKPKIGLFQAGTHKIADIPDCQVHHPSINKAAELVKRTAFELNSTMYSEVSGDGLLRYMEAVASRETGKIQLTIVFNTEDRNTEIDLFADRLWSISAGLLHSITGNFNTDRGNAIFSDRFELLKGEEFFEESIRGYTVYFPAGVFGQANLDTFENIVDELIYFVPTGARTIDLYSGVGIIGLCLMKRSSHTVFVEQNPRSIAALRLSLEANYQRDNYSVQNIPVSDALRYAGDRDVVVADPPRRGCDAELLEYINNKPPSTFILLSCDEEAFYKNAAVLIAGGAMKPRRVSPYDLFPMTGHIEILSIWERR
ncbi:MAG: methyltransferase [Planctomycetes bacterium]|nr:methyltransferase [Planctomycetota bacterium]